MTDPDLTRNLESALGLLRGHGIEPIETKDLVNGMQVRFGEPGVWCRYNFYYSEKKGFSIIAAGGDASLSNRISRILDGLEEDIHTVGPLIGSDEAGKGDYMGPLTVGAVYADERTAAKLLRIGVTDSKKLADSTIRDLAGKIGSICGEACSVVRMMPQEYNSAFRRMKSLGKNSLDMLAMCHANAIGDLFRRGFSPVSIVIDRFCPPARIRPLLPEGEYILDLRIHGESDPVVAAASILARNSYLQGLDMIGEKLGIKAVSGSGEVTDAVVRRFVGKYDARILERIAKVHFRNTSKVLENPHT